MKTKERILEWIETQGSSINREDLARFLSTLEQDNGWVIVMRIISERSRPELHKNYLLDKLDYSLYQIYHYSFDSESRSRFVKLGGKINEGETR